MSKLITSLVVAGVLAGSGFVAWKKWGGAAMPAQTAGRMPSTAVAEKRDISFAINVAGDIGPADQVSVRPEVNGKIDKLPVDIGDPVKKGELLFSLDDKDLQIGRQQQNAQIDGSKLSLKGAQVVQDQAERNFARSKQLFEERLVSQEVFDDSKTTLDRAKNDVALAGNSLLRSEKELALVDERLTKTRIFAPFDCTILTKPVSVGQAVSGSGGFNSGTEVLTIANLTDLVINAHVNQVDVTRLFVNQDVDIQIDSVPGLKLKGLVDRIAPQATIKNQIKGFACRISLKSVDPRVRPGMTANISIPVSSAANVVTVPLSAVFTEQDGRFVYVKRADGMFEKRPVRIGVSDFFRAEVQEGLTGGEDVSLEPPGARAVEAAGAGGKGKTAGKNAAGARTSLGVATVRSAKG
jgi:RND family efflux transporter MFP subunit